MKHIKKILIAATCLLCCQSALLAATLVSLEIVGDDSANEQSQATYTCIAHYSDNTTVDVTALVEWSINSPVTVAEWGDALGSAKTDAESYDIPLVYIWTVDDCYHSDNLETYIARPAFQQWMQQRRLIMVHVNAANTDSSVDKDFAKYGQNGTLYEYPFAAIYWPSENQRTWNFTARYTGGYEEQQLIAEIESYVSGYQAGAENCAYVDAGQLTTLAVDADELISIGVEYGGLNTQKQVTVLDVPGYAALQGESFETGFGIWTPSLDNDFDWRRHTGTTPSSATGPSGAADGSYYVYMEATDNYPSKTAAIETVFNRALASQPVLSFDYHMFGSSTGALYVDIYDGSWHNAVWSRTGQQHLSMSAAWSEALVNLTEYAGNIIVRIRGVTGNGFASDIAVDNIRFLEADVAPPQYFGDWLGAQSVPLELRGEADDPAGDNIPNLLKYACGLPAMQTATTADLLDIVPNAVPNSFTARYFKSKNAVNVVLEPVWSATLAGPWQSGGISSIKIDEDAVLEEWRASIPIEQAGFIRLRATLIE